MNALDIAQTEWIRQREAELGITRAETPIADLRLGDIITIAPHTNHPVHWTLASDPTTCDRGHASFSCYGLDEVLFSLVFRITDVVTAIKTVRKAAAPAASATTCDAIGGQL